jgi:hypothetical protein
MSVIPLEQNKDGQFGDKVSLPGLVKCEAYEWEESEFDLIV